MTEVRPVSALIVFTPHVAAHMARSLAVHAAWCRRSGVEMPPELAGLLELLADNGGRSRPSRDGLAAPIHAVAVTYAVAAARLGCSPRTIQRRVAEGGLRAVGKGRGRRVPVAELERFAAARKGAA